MLLPMIGWALAALGLMGLLTSTVFIGLVVVGIARFRRAAREQLAVCYAGPPYMPPVSLLKPLHGPEPGLEKNLRGFFDQDYSIDGRPQFEILFCARHASDAGLAVARRLAAESPTVPVKFLTCGVPTAPNAKVCSLEVMAAAAAHPIWVISDSDVHVGRNYLREVVSPFRDAKVGGVTCLYRGVAQEGGFWARLEAAGMSVEMSSGVLVANWMEGIRFMLGPTMVVRRECVEEMGGMGVLRDYCADDFVLGNRIAENGHAVLLSAHRIDHMVLNHGFLDSIRHQARWMKSTRFSRPKGHLGTILTFGMPFGVLALVGFSLLGMWKLGALMLGVALVGRMLQALLVGGLAAQERNPWSTVLLFPLRDLMGAVYWVMSYSSRRILWRGEVYLLEEQGRMRPVRQGLGTRD